MKSRTDIVAEVHKLLIKEGMADFQVKELELVPGHLLTRDALVQPPTEVSGIIKGLRKHLQSQGKGNLQITRFDLALRLAGGPCKDGEIPQHVCDEMPDGTIKCYIKCVKGAL